MIPPNLSRTELVKNLALMQQACEANMKFAGMPKGPLRAKVIDVDDPEERGRVRVIFDDMNKEIPEVYNAGEFSKERIGEEPEPSHWIDVSPAFKGKQPAGLIGKRVNVLPSNGQYKFACLQDVLYDPDMLAEGNQKKLEMPNNSPMTRLPCYESGNLPPATKENIGCMVIETNGPMNSDWLCVCLNRQGNFLWVRHVDLAHGHAGENDGKQPNDTNGDGEFPVEEQTVWDFVFPTSGGEMQKYSRYGTSPRANPFGGEATWYEPPK